MTPASKCGKYGLIVVDNLDGKKWNQGGDVDKTKFHQQPRVDFIGPHVIKDKVIKCTKTGC